MVSVLNREQKEQDQKAAIEPSDEIGRRARRKRDRWKWHHFVTLNTHRKSGVLGCSRHALAHPGLLPPLLPQQPARYCRRAAEGKQKEAVVLQDGWRYNCFHKSQGFPGAGGYAAACTDRLPLLEIKECLFSLKGVLYTGQGTQSLNPATPSPQMYYRLPEWRRNGDGVTIQAYSCGDWTKNER